MQEVKYTPGCELMQMSTVNQSILYETCLLVNPNDRYAFSPGQTLGLAHFEIAENVMLLASL